VLASARIQTLKPVHLTLRTTLKKGEIFGKKIQVSRTWRFCSVLKLSQLVNQKTK